MIAYLRLGRQMFTARYEVIVKRSQNDRIRLFQSIFTEVVDFIRGN